MMKFLLHHVGIKCPYLKNIPFKQMTFNVYLDSGLNILIRIDRQ